MNDDHKIAEEIFCALDGLDHMLSQAARAQSKPSFGEIFAYATNKTYQPSDKLRHALSHDLSVRRDLARLLKKQTIAFIPRAAAASTGDLRQREEDGFRLSLTQSSASSKQVYLLIEAIERHDVPHLLFIQQDDGPYLRLPIENFYDGEAQILLSEEDNIVKALRNHASEVILC